MATPAFNFRHPARVLGFWRRLVRHALSVVSTPFYLLSTEPIQAALDELQGFQKNLPVPVRHWLSCKSQPVQPLLQWWKGQGSGIEVVSEFELMAALREGFASDQVLVNGPAKHRWLPQHPIPGLRVNFDSLTEVQALLPLARQLNWSLGVRCQIGENTDGKGRVAPGQFGMERQEAAAALQRLLKSGARVETVHFHCGTNLATPTLYSNALWDVLLICQAAQFAPTYLDCGGGLPPPHVLAPDGVAYNSRFALDELASVYTRALHYFPSVRELWMENGRFVSARSGVLVVRIVDIKDRGAVRYLICDGGRTTNALVSTWEAHELFSVPTRGGPTRLTAVCGPTCMAFDQLTSRPISSRLRIGDYLVWMDAGAYHLPWETRFSHGQAAVLWHERDHVKVARSPESFEAWWGQWTVRGAEKAPC